MEIRKLFKNAVRDLIRWAVNNESVPQPEEADYAGKNASIGTISGRGRPGARFDEMNKGMNLVVYKAVGGTIIQTYEHDFQRDRVNTSLYVITDKEDLGEELGMIITRENLAR